MQASLRFPFSSSATTFPTSFFLEKTLKYRTMPRWEGCNLLAQYARENLTRQLEIWMCTALVTKQKYFTILQHLNFLFSSRKKSLRRAFAIHAFLFALYFVKKRLTLFNALCVFREFRTTMIIFLAKFLSYFQCVAFIIKEKNII